MAAVERGSGSGGGEWQQVMPGIYRWRQACVKVREAAAAEPAGR